MVGVHRESAQLTQFLGPVHHQAQPPVRLNGSNKKDGLYLGCIPLVDRDVLKERSIELKEMENQLQVLDTVCDR